MSQIQLSFLPPQYWQDFQEIVLADAQREWPDATCEMYGREGQVQNGIDVLVTDPRRGPIGIQAKKRRLFDAGGTLKLDGGLTTADIDAIITEAEKFSPPLRELVIATTALPDTKLQDHVLKLNFARDKAKKFAVRLQFWDHYQSVLNWNSDLQAIYYDSVVRRNSVEPEKLYLMMIRTAFSRPAFTTRLEVEDSGDDMVQALADTRAAIVTGILNDRQGRRIGRAPIGLDRFSGATKVNLEEAVRLLDTARQSYRQAARTGALRHDQHGIFLHEREGETTVREIDTLRGRALSAVNVALQSVGLQPLENYLIAPTG